MSDERPAHDPERFKRAFHMAKAGLVQRLGPAQFRVQSQSRKGVQYDVDLTGDPMCYCEDQDWAGRKIRGNCKHVLACKILAQDPSVIPSLMELAYQTMKRAEEAAA